MHFCNDDLENTRQRTDRRLSIDAILKESNLIEDYQAADLLKLSKRRRCSLPAVPTYQQKKMVMNSSGIFSSNQNSQTAKDMQSLLDEISVIMRQQSYYERFVNIFNSYRDEHNMGKQSLLISLEQNNSVSDEESDKVLTLKFIPPRSSRQKSRSENQKYRSTFSTTTTATGLPTEEPRLDPKIFRHLRPPSAKSHLHPQRHSSGFVFVPRHDRRLTCPDLSSSCDPLLFPSTPIAPLKKSPNRKNKSGANQRSVISPTSSSTQEEVPVATFARSSSVPPERHNSSQQPSETVASQRLKEGTKLQQVAEGILSMPTIEVRKSQGEEAEENDELREEFKEAMSFFPDYQGQLMQEISSWNFPMFELAYKTDHVMSQMAYKIFRDMGIFDTFKLGQKEFVNFMMALESGYRDIEYHNRIHAADVLHGCWYLTSQSTPGFDAIKMTREGSCIEEKPVEDAQKENGNPEEASTENYEKSKSGCLADVMPALELMALYLAAAMHDYDHPGRTNAFLVETRDPLALLYNDRSVLESHHSAAAWKLFDSKPEFNFLKNLDDVEWKRLRFLVIEAVLATDLKKHFDLQHEFTKKTGPRSMSLGSDDGSAEPRTVQGVDWKVSEDRLLVSKMVIKLADIGGPAKTRRLHMTWTKSICQEFFDQGDQERKLGLAVSRHMDREAPEVAVLQVDFINHILEPMVSTMNRAGILPCENEPPKDANDQNKDDEAAEELLIEGAEDKKTINPNIHSCPLLEHLKNNLGYWKEKPLVKGKEAVKQMDEAFSCAYPVVLSRSQASQIDHSAFESQTS